ncbi:MAG: nucleotidyltransferase [Nitrospiraceae bacterium]|nr:MAG: nucleotidyltransferase [Nitrospiraceae bacterium]
MALNITQAFNLFKSKLELSQSFQEEVTTHHNAIREWIESYDSTIETKLIGSLQRKTRIQPWSEDIFDIDILVILGSFYNWLPSGGIKPEDALEKIEDIVTEHGTYEKLGVETDNPTITFEYEDNVKVELVPAYLDQIGKAPDGTSTLPVGRGYWIPKNNKWVIADYDYDAEHIASSNENSDGYLIPIIKILKAAKRNLFPMMKSYHLEVIAASLILIIINYYKEQKWQINYPSLVYNFFLLGKDEVLKAANIPASKSPSSDGYMSITEKQGLSTLFDKIAEHCKKTFAMSDNEAIEAWRKLFDAPFPVSAYHE